MVLSVSFGGGLNSTALLVEMHARGVRPDYVLFADTGGERAHTYGHAAEVSAWLVGRGFPPVTTVTNADPAGERHGHASLEAECLTNRTLPSLAYGNKGCSVKWKRQPMERFLRAQPDVAATHAAGLKVDVYLGIDAGEAHRSAGLMEDTHALWRYHRPLVEWDIDRERCAEIVRAAGLAVPAKSACWFCPASRKREVLALGVEAPGLFERAVALEHAAAGSNRRVRGLGRHWSWESLVRADRAQMRLFPDAPAEDCMCYDGHAQEAPDAE